jgi:hypothetical protein
VVAAAFVFLLTQRYRTPEMVAWTTLGVLVGLALIQLFATEPRHRAPAPDMAGTAVREAPAT